MLTKAVVFLFCIMAVFGLILGNVPHEFTDVSLPSYVSPMTKSVASYFDLNNYTTYDSAYSENMTYPYDYKDIPTSLGGSDYLEMYWQLVNLGWGVDFQAIHLRHATGQWYGRSGHDLSWEFSVPGYSWALNNYYIERDDVVKGWNASGLNNTLFTGYCEHLVANLVIYPVNSTYNITQAWDAGEIGYMISYDLNMNGTSLNFWTLIGRLFTFQPLSLGLGTIGETIIGGVVSSFMWALVLIVIYKVTTGIIPWLSGGSGD